MSEQLQLRRGTASQVAAFTGAQGETVMDTTNNRLVVNDGSTVGGWPAAKLSEVQTNARTAVSDAAYTALTTDRLIAYTALTASRTVSLPAASNFPAGSYLTIVDETGNCAASKQIVIAPNGTDDINGANADYVIALAYGWVKLESNGTSWTIVGQMAAAQGPNGANIQFAVIEHLLSGLSGASVTWSTAIPANCILFAVGAYVTTAITASGSPTGIDIGDSGQSGDSGNSTTRFGSNVGMSAGTSNYGIIGPTGIYSAVNVIVQPHGGTSPSFTAGAIRLSAHIGYFNPSNS